MDALSDARIEGALASALLGVTLAERGILFDGPESPSDRRTRIAVGWCMNEIWESIAEPIVALAPRLMKPEWASSIRSNTTFPASTMRSVPAENGPERLGSRGAAGTIAGDASEYQRLWPLLLADSVCMCLVESLELLSRVLVDADHAARMRIAVWVACGVCQRWLQSIALGPRVAASDAAESTARTETTRSDAPLRAARRDLAAYAHHAEMQYHAWARRSERRKGVWVYRTFAETPLGIYYVTDHAFASGRSWAEVTNVFRAVVSAVLEHVCTDRAGSGAQAGLNHALGAVTAELASIDGADGSEPTLDFALDRGRTLRECLEDFAHVYRSPVVVPRMTRRVRSEGNQGEVLARADAVEIVVGASVAEQLLGAMIHMAASASSPTELHARALIGALRSVYAIRAWLVAPTLRVHSLCDAPVLGMDAVPPIDAIDEADPGVVHDASAWMEREIHRIMGEVSVSSRGA